MTVPSDAAATPMGGISDQVRAQCRMIAEHARVVTGAPRAILLLYDETIRRLVTVATTGADFPLQQVAINLIKRNYPGIDPLEMSYRPTVNPSVAGAFVGQRTQINSMAEAFEGIYPPGISIIAQGLVGITHVVSCPVSHQGRALGVIRFLVPAPPTAEQQALMEAAASQIALTLANARLAEEAQRRLAAHRAISEIARIGLISGMDAMYTALADRVRELTAADDAVIFLVDPGGETYSGVGESVSEEARARGQSRMPAPPRRVGDGLVGWVIASNEAAFIPDARRDPRTQSSRQIEGIEAVVAVPMRASGGAIGCIRLGVVGMRRFTEEDLWLAQSFADEAARALALAREVGRARAEAYAAGAREAHGRRDGEAPDGASCHDAPAER